MALTQISTQGIKDGTITGSDLATNIDLVDNQKLRLGTGNDLEVYHSGSHAIIENVGDGYLFLNNTNANIYLRPATGEDGIIVKTNAAVELYHDNSKKFETTSTGATVTGDLSVTANIDLADSTGGSNNRILLGTGDDLSLYHDGSNGYLYNSGSGNLTLVGNGTNRIQIRADVNKNSITCNADGNVELYYDNALRLDTMIEGAKVKRHGGGSTTLYVEGAENASAILALYADDGDDNADKYRIVASSGGGLYFSNYIDGSWETNIKFTETTGGVELYYNNSKKLETGASGVAVTGYVNLLGDGTNSGGSLYIPDSNGNSSKIHVGTGSDLQIYHDGTDSYIQNTTEVLRINNDGTDLVISTDNNIHIRTNGTEEAVKAIANGAVELYHDNSKKLNTKSTGIHVTGNVHAAPAGTSFSTDNDTYIFQAAAPSQAYLSAYCANTGTSLSANGFHFGMDGTSHNIIGRENKNINFYTDDAHRLVLQNDGHLRAAANNTFDLGTSSIRWRNIYTNDLNLSNEGGANDVDGTWGSFTIQEGSEDLFLINKRSGKKYKFNLTEVA